MKEQTREDPKILAAAERRMHAWVMAEQIENRAVRQRSDALPTARVLEFVAISREAGAGGGEIGLCAGQRLGWHVYDRNLLDQVANQFHVSRTMLDLVDETRSNWVYDVLGTWMDRKIVPHEKYVAYLSRVLLAAAQQGNAVFIGRGAQFLLPRQKLLAVRIVASEKHRIQQIIDRTGTSEAVAKRCMQEIDEGRREFVDRFFHHDIADSHHYDLVINVDRCGPEGAVRQIVAALGR
jgi:cytidylate kinase